MSAHGEILAEMLDEVGIRPAETVEADHELLIHSLVAAGVGIGLMREELALRHERDGQLFLFDAPGHDDALLHLFAGPRRRPGDRGHGGPAASHVGVVT